MIIIWKEFHDQSDRKKTTHIHTHTHHTYAYIYIYIYICVCVIRIKKISTTYRIKIYRDGYSISIFPPVLYYSDA